MYAIDGKISGVDAYCTVKEISLKDNLCLEI
jgi:hypothetical protein